MSNSVLTLIATGEIVIASRGDYEFASGFYSGAQAGDGTPVSASLSAFSKTSSAERTTEIAARPGSWWTGCWLTLCLRG